MAEQARILLIDDDPDFLESTKAVLESRYEVVTANNPQEGLDKALAESPNLIICDVIMPDIDGFTVADRLKQEKQLSRVPLLMLTSLAARAKEANIPRDRGVSLQAEDYLDKPVAPEALLATVESWLNKAQSWGPA